MNSTGWKSKYPGCGLQDYLDFAEGYGETAHYFRLQEGETERVLGRLDWSRVFAEYIVGKRPHSPEAL